MPAPSKRPEVEAQLRDGLDAFLADRRNQDPPVPWDEISFEIRQQTGIVVTGETLRRWWAES